MVMELSYSQLKSSSEARESEELRNETRKRSLILLIHSYLNEQGYINAGWCVSVFVSLGVCVQVCVVHVCVVHVCVVHVCVACVCVKFSKSSKY